MGIGFSGVLQYIKSLYNNMRKFNRVTKQENTVHNL